MQHNEDTDKVKQMQQGIEYTARPDEAILTSEGNYTSFIYRDTHIRFRTSSKLERYTQIREWDHGYIVVMAKYSFNSDDEEEYIDLIPILENLYIDADEFLAPIKKVRISYDGY